MSAATPAPAFPVRYGDTQSGRASEWTRGYVPGQREADMHRVNDDADFQDALESLGCRKAAQMMRESMDEITGQVCP